MVITSKEYFNFERLLAGMYPLFLHIFKASETISMSFFDALLRWNEISNTLPENNYVVYAGDENQKRKKGQIISWLSEATLVEKLSK